MIAPETLAELGWPTLLEHLAAGCRTPGGIARAAALAPLESIDDARRRIALVGEARALAAQHQAPTLAGIGEIADALVLAAKGGALEPEVLVAVAHTARVCHGLRAHLGARREAAPGLADLGRELADLSHVFHPILASFDADHQLVDQASDELGPLRRAVGRIRLELDARARELATELGDHLQDDYTTQREDRYVLPIRAEARWQVKGIVHGTSQSGQTVFIEPEGLIELNNQLKLAEYAVRDEERRILARLSGYVAEEAAALGRAVAIAVEVDLVVAAAALADRLRGFPPELTDGGPIDLRRLRHPLMELGGRPCVPNDVRIAAGHALVISGPNAGGKTVALKAVGLAVLMARAGLHVAAGEGSLVPWFVGVASDIGDAQSIEKNLSTFSGHLLNVSRMVRAAGPHGLVLVDELCVGTEPEQGAALAQATLERLCEAGCTSIVTTHYEQLKALAPVDPRFANASVGFDLDAMAPTFKLELGVPGSSGALLLARRLGLDAALIARAEVLVGQDRGQLEDLLAEISSERRRLEQAHAEVARTLAEAELERDRVQDTRRRLADRDRSQLEDSHGQAVAALREARLQLDQVRVGIRKKAATVDEARAAERSVDELAREVRKHAPAPAAAAGSPPGLAELTPGTAVVVVSLGGRGVVVSPPERGKLTVQVGIIKSVVDVSDVRLDRQPPAAKKPKPSAPRAAPAARRDEFAMTSVNHEARAFVRDRESTLDVRGERADDAIAGLERFVDDSLLAGREVVFVVHGHGTGALRTAIRQHLHRHKIVKSFRPGEPSEGGDGVTVAFLEPG